MVDVTWVPLPENLQHLATHTKQLYPSGIVIVHLDFGRCCLLEAGSLPRPLHLHCAIALLRYRLAIGVVILQGAAHALRIGRRVAPLVRLIRTLLSVARGG